MKTRTQVYVFFKRHMFRVLMIITLLLPLFMGCSDIPIFSSYKWKFEPDKYSSNDIKAGKARDDIKRLFNIHRGNWWNYYDRGLSFMEEGFWDYAIEDFEKAISMRSKDERSAITYGLHRMDYFVNRELGIAYYKLAQDDDLLKQLLNKESGIKELFKKNNKDDLLEFTTLESLKLKSYDMASIHLKNSLNVVESSEAQFYLGEILKGLKLKSKLKSIKITPYKNRNIVEYPIVTLNIEITDDFPIDSVWINDGINDKLIFIELAKKELKFRQDIILTKKGENQITVKVRNLGGEYYTQTITINYFEQTKNRKASNTYMQGNKKWSLKGSNKPVLLATTNDTIFLKQFALGINSDTDKNISNLTQKERNFEDFKSKVKDLLPNEERYSILLLPFQNLKDNRKIAGTDLDLVEEVFNTFKSKIKETARLNYVEYNKDDLNAFIDKENLDNKKIQDIKNIKSWIDKIKEDKKIDAIIRGKIGIKKRDEGETVIDAIEAEVYDLEKKEVILTKDEYKIEEKDGERPINLDDINDIKPAVKRLTSKILNEFPDISSVVDQVIGNEFSSNFGGDNNRLKNLKLIPFKPIDFKGQIRWMRIHAEGKVTRTCNDYINAEIITGTDTVKDINKISDGDFVKVK